MLVLTIPERSLWDEINECFVYSKGGTLTLEHSLLSITKWESKWKKPFLTKQQKTMDEMRDYIRCMDINSRTDPSVYMGIGKKELDQVLAYIDDTMTATTFNERGNKKTSRDIITNEIIYYWMVECGIPFDPCEKWHLNRLMALIRVVNLKQQPAKKMNQKEWLSQRSELNAARRKAHRSHG